MGTEKEIDFENLYSSQYCVRNNCLYRKKYVKNKKEPELCLLCNFAPFIVKQIVLEDGERAVIRLKIAAVAESGRRLQEVELSVDELTNPNWAAKIWGSECSVEVGSAVKEYIRHAVQSTAKHAENVILYSITGWKEINGEYYFLMPGDDEKTVALPNKMSGYKMQREYTEADIAQAFSFLENTVAPKEIIYPLLAITFTSTINCFLREAGCEPKMVMLLIGKTGSKKSTLAALMLSFFGTFTASTLPLSFKDTPNSIMHHAYSLKDTLTCIDDFHPSGKVDENNMTNTMQMILRSYGDRVGRGRLSSSSEAMETRYPQGNAIITAEYAPDIGESGTSRYIAIEMSPDSLNNTFLTLYQEEAAKGRLNACMFAFTEWLRQSILNKRELKEKFIERLRKEYVRTRDAVTKRLSENKVTFHPRIPEDVAVLRLGFEMFLQFIRFKELIDEDAVERYLTDYDEVMYAVAVSQSRSVEQDRPVYKFLCKLCSLLDSGRYYLVPKANGRIEKDNRCLGYEDDDNYYLFKTQTHQAVRKLCDEQGESFTITDTALAKALKAENLVIPGDKQITRPVRINDSTLLRLLVIPKAKVKEIVERFS